MCVCGVCDKPQLGRARDTSLATAPAACVTGAGTRQQALDSTTIVTAHECPFTHAITCVVKQDGFAVTLTGSQTE
jgi:hypothetical protein